MSHVTILKEDLELNELRETEQQLLQRHKEMAELPKRLEQEKRDRDCTMPPLSDISERRRRALHEECVSRGEVANVHREQRRSLALLFLLIAATAALVMWGLRLMQG